MADAFFTRAPSTIVTMAINGQTEFTIPFEFLARKFVVVTLLGVDRKVLTINTDYRFIAVNKIRLERPAPAGYPRIELRRVTSTTDRLVTFIDGSILRATDLNLAQVQTMHVAEEARDLTSDTIGVNDEGHLDARNRKVVNLANATDPLDAVNLGQLRQFDASTANNADKAQAAATAAKVSETNAKNSENRSVVAEANAVSSAEAAMNAVSDANNSKLSAKQYADAANASSADALSYSQSAKNEADRATAQADRATTQADRAEQEADKLENLNGFSQTITEVTPTHVKFNRNLVAEAMNVQTAAGKPPVVQVWREGIGELLMTVDGLGNRGFQPSLDASFMGYWNPAGNTYVSNVSHNIDIGSRAIRGSLKVQKEGSASFSLTDTVVSPAAGTWVSSSQYGWFGGALTLGNVRGDSRDSNGLIRHISDGNPVGADIWLTPDSANEFIRFGQSNGTVTHRFSKDGNIFMGKYNDWLTNVIAGRTPKRWTWVNLGSMPVSNDAVLNLPFDVRGLRGFFGFGGERGETVYKQFTFPPLDCSFQINRKGDWQVFQLTNNGTRLIRRYGWAEGGDPYFFYCEPIA